MNILSLLQGRRPNRLYDDFLGAYAQLRESRDVPDSLKTILKCLREEEGTGSSKCMEYFVSHDMDRVVLQLHPSDGCPVEEFFDGLLALCPAAYLSGEFFRQVWRHDGFDRLCLKYAGLCEEHGLFNAELAARVIASVGSSAASREALLRLIRMDEYRRYFREMELGGMLARLAREELLLRSSSATAIMAVACEYADVVGGDLMSQVDLENILRERGEGAPEDELSLLMDLFVKVDSVVLRTKIVRCSLRWIRSARFPEFLSCCLLADPVCLGSLLAEKREKAQWNPAQIHGLLSGSVLADRIDASDDKTDNLSVTQELTSFFSCSGFQISEDDVFSDQIYLGKFINQLHTVKSTRSAKFSLLNYLLESGYPDIRVYLFLYFVDPRTLFDSLPRIHRTVAAAQRARLLRMLRLLVERA